MPTKSTKPHASPALPLDDLTAWVSPSCLVHSKDSKKKKTEQPNEGESADANHQPATVLEWLKYGDVEAAKWQEEMEANGADQLIDFFAMSNNNNDENDDSDAASVDSNVDFEGVYGRIRVWESSKENVDGVGNQFKGEEKNSESSDSDEVKLTYIISEAWEGFGVRPGNRKCCVPLFLSYESHDFSAFSFRIFYGLHRGIYPINLPMLLNAESCLAYPKTTIHDNIRSRTAPSWNLAPDVQCLPWLQ